MYPSDAYHALITIFIPLLTKSRPWVLRPSPHFRKRSPHSHKLQVCRSLTQASLMLLGSNSPNIDTFLLASSVPLLADRILTSAEPPAINNFQTTCNNMGDTRPSHHANSSASLFKNPWVQPKSVLESGRGLFNNFPLALAKQLHDHPALPVKVIEPDWGEDEPNQGRVKATWLGHAVGQNRTLAQSGAPEWHLRGFWFNFLRPTIHQLNQPE